MRGLMGFVQAVGSDHLWGNSVLEGQAHNAMSGFGSLQSIRNERRKMTKKKLHQGWGGPILDLME